MISAARVKFSLLVARTRPLEHRALVLEGVLLLAHCLLAGLVQLLRRYICDRRGRLIWPLAQRHGLGCDLTRDGCSWRISEHRVSCLSVRRPGDLEFLHGEEVRVSGLRGGYVRVAADRTARLLCLSVVRDCDRTIGGLVVHLEDLSHAHGGGLPVSVGRSA